MVTILAGGLLLAGGAATVAGVAGGVTAGAVAVHARRKKKRLKALRKKLFNEPLETLESKYLTQSGIPLVIELTCKSLEECGAETEGIFRVPGSVSRIQVLADMFRKGKLKYLEKLNLKLEDPHDVGGLFKLYLRSLPNSLCTSELYNEFYSAQESSRSDEEWLLKIVFLLEQLPPRSQLLMLRLLKFFAYISSLSDKNKMTVDNLSIVFGPTLFSCDADPVILLSHSSVICGLLARMITRHEEISQRVKLNRPKLSKNTVNASMLFKQQDMVTSPFEVSEEGEEYMNEEEIAEIRELLEDELVIDDQEEPNKSTSSEPSLGDKYFSKPLPTPSDRSFSCDSIQRRSFKGAEEPSLSRTPSYQDQFRRRPVPPPRRPPAAV